MQDPLILSFLLPFHLVWLLETKTSRNISVPGFKVFSNPSRLGEHRGGIIMRLKQALVKFVRNVDMSVEGQIWVKFWCFPNINFGGVYIPPEDSIYYDVNLFGNLESKLVMERSVVVMGDFNARIAKPPIVNAPSEPYYYEGIKDFTINNHGKLLRDLCVNNDVVTANHLSINSVQMGGNLSNRKGKEWVSEIDLCLVKNISLRSLRYLDIKQDMKGSDHAPLTMEMDLTEFACVPTSMLAERAQDLGQSFHKPIMRHYNKSISHNLVNKSDFMNRLSSVPPPEIFNIEANELSNAIDNGFKTVDSVAKVCRIQVNENNETWETANPRWKRVLDSNESKVIWKAINWKGGVNETDVTQPSDLDFKTHFENLLNPPNDTQSTLDDSELENAPYIPLLDDPIALNEMEQALRGINENKAYIGLCPGLLKKLPVVWIAFFLNILNMVFFGIFYPVSWCFDRLVILFKSGDRLNCGNYRGINIIDSICKQTI